MRRWPTAAAPAEAVGAAGGYSLGAGPSSPVHELPGTPRRTHVGTGGLLPRAAPRALQEAEVCGLTEGHTAGWPSWIVERPKEQSEGALFGLHGVGIVPETIISLRQDM